MKILILQLARLGDIYLTWPLTRALKRLHPEAEIHVLSRARFAGAWQGNQQVDQVHSLPGEAWMEPLLSPEFDVAESFSRVVGFLQALKSENFTAIYNLSYSPLSSYLTNSLRGERTEQVAGYTRFSDGYLSIPDDMSAYFYAQVGVDRANRYHLAEIFGSVAGVDLIPEDWQSPVGLPAFQGSAHVLIHISTSEKQKSLSPEKWINFINGLLRKNHDVTVGLIGQLSESDLASRIMGSVTSTKVKSFVGATGLGELFTLIQAAQIVVGCDSAPIHMASLVGTPCLQFSIGRVNFFETGPRAPGSLVVRAKNEEDLSSDYMVNVLTAKLNGDSPDPGVYPLVSGQPCFAAMATSEANFQWNLLQAIYTGTAFPISENKIFNLGMTRLAEVNELIKDQLKYIAKGGSIDRVAELIQRGEEIISAVGGMLPSLAIVTRWYQTEKTRIPPGTTEEVLHRTREIHDQLDRLVAVYADKSPQVGKPSEVGAS